uniref:Uncharacterized protein n=2 Tax=Cercopithecinae TaxID=9528 RepID=A0A2K5LIJ0_CERAT
IIEGWCCILHDPDTVGEEEEKARWAALTHTAYDQKFAQQEEEVGNFVQDSHSAGDSEGQEEGIPGRGAEIGAVDGNLEESIPIEEFDELLQAPEAAFETGHEALGKLVLCANASRGWARTFQPLIQVLEYHTNDLHNGQDERAKGQGARVVPRPAKGREEREGWQVVRLAQGPVVGGKGPGQCDLAQSQHEVGQPEEHEGIEDLQAQQGPVVARLTTIEGELAGLVGGGEGLWERRENRVQKEAPGVHSGL